MNRKKNRGLVYLRRSTDKQEISLAKQLEWAIARARQQDVVLDATMADLEHMQARRLHSYKDLRLDDGISGSDLSRPGFLAFNANTLQDESISHVFFFKRDRFSRADDAMQPAQMEKRLLLAGVTVVHSDGVTLPLQRGEQNILRDMELLLSYYQGGEELRKLAERILGAQQKLAEGGHRVGGNAPYGFVRVLVDIGGNVLEQLPRGKTVRQQGCHVRVIPKDLEKIAIWLQILEWRHRGLGCKRIAKQLNDRGVPSPDAGRTRTDQGVRHRVTGRWNASTVAELCRNEIIMGIQSYGHRSEGRIRRLGGDGPRLLEDKKDLTHDGRPRVISNDPALWITKSVGEAQFDSEKWSSIQRIAEERGRNQRGIPRAKDPARYPLACRLLDLTDNCGSILYGRTTHGRAVYTCSRYMKSAGADCHSNQVDGEAILRFTMLTLKQFVDQHGRHERLRQKLLERAHRESARSDDDQRSTELKRLRCRYAELKEESDTIEFRMARERDEQIYERLKHQYREALSQLAEMAETIKRAEVSAIVREAACPEKQVEAAMALLDDVARVATDTNARTEVKALLKRLGLWIGLTFQPAIKGKKRAVQQLVSGQIVFGDGKLPVPIFGQDNVDDISGDQQNCPASDAEAEICGSKKNVEAGVCPAPVHVLSDEAPPDLTRSQPEGISITKVSRGDWIRTSDLLNPIQAR
jgi:hypothetical protein